jgi:CDP-6-deoxy-D-xylo-4-hexulose-3-dehydrase
MIMQTDKSKEIRKKILDLVRLYSDYNFLNKNFIKGETDIPVSGKVIGTLELQNMVEASLDGWLTTGRFNKGFEDKLSLFLGVKCLLTVNSGSSANLIAFSTLTSSKLKERSIQKGDEVLTVAAGFPTTVNPIIQFGAIPVFIDVKIPTYNIDENLVEEAITEKTKAIMLAHTLGNPFNVKKIKEICDKYNLWLIEDSCDALGSKFNNQFVGTFGDLATLSFYPAHHITMGEGGAIFTNNKKLERIAESFRDWGRDCYCEPGKDNTCNKRFGWKLGDLPFGYDHKYTYSHLGYNMKITDMQAACGLAQLDRLEGFIKKRKENFNFLYKNLKDLEEFLILPEPEKNSEPSWFGFPLSLKKNIKYNRNDLIKYLDANKIGTRLLFSGNLIKQPYMKNAKFKVHGELKNTDLVMENTFWIGLFPGLTKEHLQYSFVKIKKFFKA